LTGDTCINLFALGAGIIFDLVFPINSKAIKLSGILNATYPEFEETISKFGKLFLTLMIIDIGPGQ